MSRGPLVILMLAGLAVASGGCQLYHPRPGEPRTIQQQRYSAVLHDPYADQDLGPAVVGGRPATSSGRSPSRSASGGSSTAGGAAEARPARRTRRRPPRP